MSAVPRPLAARRGGREAWPPARSSACEPERAAGRGRGARARSVGVVRLARRAGGASCWPRPLPGAAARARSTSHDPAQHPGPRAASGRPCAASWSARASLRGRAASPWCCPIPWPASRCARGGGRAARRRRDRGADPLPAAQVRALRDPRGADRRGRRRAAARRPRRWWRPSLGRCSRATRRRAVGLGLEPGLVELAGLALLVAAFGAAAAGDRLLVNWDEGYVTLSWRAASGRSWCARCPGRRRRPTRWRARSANTVLYYRERLGGPGPRGGASCARPPCPPEEAGGPAERAARARARGRRPVGERSAAATAVGQAGAGAGRRAGGLRGEGGVRCRSTSPAGPSATSGCPPLLVRVGVAVLLVGSPSSTRSSCAACCPAATSALAPGGGAPGGGARAAARRGGRSARRRAGADGCSRSGRCSRTWWTAAPSPGPACSRASRRCCPRACGWSPSPRRRARASFGLEVDAVARSAEDAAGSWSRSWRTRPEFEDVFPRRERRRGRRRVPLHDALPPGGRVRQPGAPRPASGGAAAERPAAEERGACASPARRRRAVSAALQPFWRRRLLVPALALLGLNVAVFVAYTLPRGAPASATSRRVRRSCAREVERSARRSRRSGRRADTHARRTAADVERFYARWSGRAGGARARARGDRGAGPELGLKPGGAQLQRRGGQGRRSPLEVGMPVPLTGTYRQLVASWAGSSARSTS